MMNDDNGPRFNPASFIIYTPSSPRLMFKQFISQIPGADIYMVGSFLTFLAFFVLVGLYLLLVDKTYIQQMGRMPLDDSSTD
ncbi:hypothetical protein GCM10028806_42590 [Spirosoma terrae]